MPDACFAHPRLAAIYDALHPDRRDLVLYESIVSELDAQSVLDIGCGTGTLACRLAAQGVETAGLDPAGASLDIARGREHAQLVQWVEGDASAAGLMSVDLVLMTGNVAQVFLRDDEWRATLIATRSALSSRGVGGHFVFESRIPSDRGWEAWTPATSRSTIDTVEGRVESWVELIEVEPPFVSFRWTYRFLDDGTEMTSDSTLRFREWRELTASLEDAGFSIRATRDAPDRPGREWVIIASATS